MCDAEAQRLKEIHARMHAVMAGGALARAQRHLNKSDSLPPPETTITIPRDDYNALVSAKTPTITTPLDGRDTPPSMVPRRNAMPVMALRLESTVEHYSPDDTKRGLRRFDVVPRPDYTPELGGIVYIDGEEFCVQGYYIYDGDVGWEMLVSEVIKTPSEIPCHEMIAGSFKSLAQTSVGFTEKEGASTFILSTASHDRPMPKKGSAILIDGSPYQVWHWGPGKDKVLVQGTAQTARVVERSMTIDPASEVEGQEDLVIVGRFTAEMYGHDGHGGFMALIKIPVFYTYDLKPEDTITLDGLLFEVEGVEGVPDENLYWWISCKPVFLPPTLTPCPGVRRSAQVDIQIRPREWPDGMHTYLTGSQDTQWQPTSPQGSDRSNRLFGLGS